MAEFSLDLKGFADKIGVSTDKVMRKVALDLVRDFVKATPVDTGHARSNWFVGTEPLSTVDPAKDKEGAPSLARASQFASSGKVGAVFYITNNVPYIMPLEYGHSQRQAPAGMVRVTLARWQAMVSAAALQVGGQG